MSLTKINTRQTDFNDGWINADETWTYASATTITVPSGAVSKYAKGDKIKLTQTTVKYFYIIGVADTVLTVTGGSDYAVADAAITANYYSHQSSPIGFPTWFTYTPTLTGGGDITISSQDDVRFRKFAIVSNMVIFNIEIGFTIGGTGNSPLIYATLPVTANNSYSVSGGATCYESNWKGGNIQASDTSKVGVIKYDNSNWSTGAAKYIKFSVNYAI